MATHYVGTDVRLTALVQTSADVAIDPTTLKVRVKTPDGAFSAWWVYGIDANVIKDGTGSYYVDYTTTMDGTHWQQWIGTGVAIVAGEVPFIVQPTRFPAT